MKLVGNASITPQTKVTVELDLAQIALIEKYAGRNSTGSSKDELQKIYPEAAACVKHNFYEPNKDLYVGALEILKRFGIITKED
jgi:hypothetical protein